MKYLLQYLFFLLLFSSCTLNNNSNEIKKSNFKFRSLTKKEKNKYTHYANEIYQQLLGNHFNGSILVAKNGEIILEHYKGIYNISNGEPITVNTPFHIASISKTFTAMAILRLSEQGKLKIEDSLQQYFPSFPYHNISIQQLLSHRSGLPNYVYFLDTAFKKNKFATNSDVIQFLIEHQPVPYSNPNVHFHYCNTNYVLLALIIEKVTGLNYPQYLQDSIFSLAKMKHSFVFSIKDTSHFIPSYNYNNQTFTLENIDCIYGDKNIYSTVRDLLQWDKALYNNNIVKNETYLKAIKGYSNEKRTHHNYGLGWRLLQSEKDTAVYHNGWWHGNNTVFIRLIKDTATIIALGNKFNRMIYNAAKIKQIFSGSSNDDKLEN